MIPRICLLLVVIWKKRHFKETSMCPSYVGKRIRHHQGKVYTALKNAFSVFDSAANTPTYWKKAKYEMMAKLDNLGPFQFFFTLSCADKLWNENVTTILEEKGIKVHYGYDEFGKEETLVQVEKG